MDDHDFCGFVISVFRDWTRHESEPPGYYAEVYNCTDPDDADPVFVTGFSPSPHEAREEAREWCREQEESEHAGR